MPECDILIVGGGPAGSTLAWSLRHSGLSVTIMDKADFPRDKVCAGWVTPAVVEQLQIDVEAYGRERTMQPITGFRIGILGRPQLETHYAGRPVSYGIRRSEFDHYLLQRSGANLLLHTPLESMEPTPEGWRVNGEIRARLVVGAGGHFCPVARAVGFRPSGAELLVAAQEIEYLMPPEQAAACRVDPAVPELYFLPDLRGYGWAFRKDDYINIGLGREENVRVSDHVQAFRDHLVATGRISPEAPAKFKGHAYLLYHHALRGIAQDGVMLIGDSAGLAYPESGEGIRPAVDSALLAGQVIRSAQGDHGLDTVHRYLDLLTGRFGDRQPKPGFLDRVPMWIKRPLAARLMRSRWFVRKVLIEQWFLHKDVPLIATG